MNRFLSNNGDFIVGCNYWASHAGTAMWRNWQEDTVAVDLRCLAAAGMEVLRVFPLWPDFQPLTALRTAGGRFVECRHGDAPLPDPSGVDPIMLEHFGRLLDLAAAEDLQLVVGLVTGWMSGRLFVPSAFDGRNVITDPMARRWQRRFVQRMVRTFRKHPAIAAWDLGNECNCMGTAEVDDAYDWTATIADAIRAVDPSRPVISGMHSLSVRRDRAWNIHDQAELTDILTTHPYPLFTAHCDRDPVDSTRGILHAAAETCLYRDLGGRPAFAEETGTLGPMVADDETAARVMRGRLFSLWAHDCRGLLWWGAFDQDHLGHPPYEWIALERELGLFTATREAKPAAAAMRAFRDVVQSVGSLPIARREAVCILDRDHDAWGAAFAAFVLAQQAGFDLTFQYRDQPLRPAALYLLPSLEGHSGPPAGLWRELRAAVAAGATLYLSLGTGFVSGFEELTGIRVRRRSQGADVTVSFLTLTDATLTVVRPTALELAVGRAEVLGTDANSAPVCTRADYGNGEVFLLTAPLETALVGQPGGFDGPAWQLYRRVAARATGKRIVRKQAPQLGITEHPHGNGRATVVVNNYCAAPVRDQLELAAGWTVESCLYGNPPGPDFEVGANDAAIFTVSNSDNKD